LEDDFFEEKKYKANKATPTAKTKEEDSKIRKEKQNKVR